MMQNLNSILHSSCAIDSALLVEFRDLWADAQKIWDQHHETPAFHGYVSADYLSVYRSLTRLRSRVTSILEWGSGLGVVTIMASRMGFVAYGIEAEQCLVSHSENLARSYGSKASFAQGSFIPNDFVWEPADGKKAYRTATDLASAYERFAMRLDDFDLVYAYPWPKELALYRRIMRECGRSDAMMLTYDSRVGMDLVRFRQT